MASSSEPRVWTTYRPTASAGTDRVLLVDTGVIVAAGDRSDPRRTACARLLEETEGTLLASPLVIAEAPYLLDRELGTRALTAKVGRVSQRDRASPRSVSSGDPHSIMKS